MDRSVILGQRGRREDLQRGTSVLVTVFFPQWQITTFQSCSRFFPLLGFGLEWIPPGFFRGMTHLCFYLWTKKKKHLLRQKHSTNKNVFFKYKNMVKTWYLLPKNIKSFELNKNQQENHTFPAVSRQRYLFFWCTAAEPSSRTVRLPAPLLPTLCRIWTWSLCGTHLHHHRPPELPPRMPAGHRSPAACRLMTVKVFQWKQCPHDKAHLSGHPCSPRSSLCVSKQPTPRLRLWSKQVNVFSCSSAQQRQARV